MNVVLVRAGYALLLAIAGLGFKPWLSDRLLPGAAVMPELNLLRMEAGSLCAGDCTCSYCDQVINGRCYTNGQRGYGLCTTSCDTDNCNFRPNIDGCGPILYLGCDDDDCRGTPLPVPSPTKDRIIIIGPSGTPTPQPTPAPTPAPTPTPVSPDPGPSVCQPPLEWTVMVPPQITAVTHSPPFPVLQTQEFGEGVDHTVFFHVDVGGGRALVHAKREKRVCRTAGNYPQDCPDDWTAVCETYLKAAYDDPVAEVSTNLQLSAASRVWITGYLESRYPKASVRQPTSSGGNWTGSTMGGAVDLSGWQPKDPGVHEGTARLLTKGTAVSPPQSVQLAHSVEVHLRDTTLTK